MSVYPTEYIFYGSANMPEADGVTNGGAIDLTRMVSFSDMAANGLVNIVSSSASDTATRIVVSGLDGSGIQLTTSYAILTGTTKIGFSGNPSFSRLLYGATSGATANGPLANPLGTAAVGDIAVMAQSLTLSSRTCQAGSAQNTGVTPALIKLQAGDGASITLGMIIRTTGGTGPNQIRMAMSTSGTGAGQYGTDTIAVNRPWTVLPDATTTYEVATGMLFPILPNPVTSVVRLFSGVAADITGGSTRVYYETIHGLNTDGVTALTAQTIIKQTDPATLYSGGGSLDFAPASTLNYTTTSANRQTAPTGIGAFSSGAAPQTITPAAQTAASNTAAQAQGLVARLTLPPGLAPANGSFTLRNAATTA